MLYRERADLRKRPASEQATHGCNCSVPAVRDDVCGSGRGSWVWLMSGNTDREVRVSAGQRQKHLSSCCSQLLSGLKRVKYGERRSL